MENKVKTLKNFLEEYERIKPLEEFDEKRNVNIISKVDDVMELFDCPSWYWFIALANCLFIYRKKKIIQLLLL